MRVLLIEDDRMIGTAIEVALKDAAYAVDWVTDGETAVHAAENESSELALLDLGLPKADGREVLRRLRTLGRRLPVIIVTARDGVDDVPRLRPITWKNKAAGALATMAMVKHQLKRLGRGRATNHNVGPLFALIGSQIETALKARQYRRWAAARAAA